MQKLNRIALGTVQFGLKYGINNSRGIVTEKELASILKTALISGVDLIDTAFAYGNSEQRLGDSKIEEFKIVTKLPNCSPLEVKHKFEESLSYLKRKSIYGYLIHNSKTYFENKTIWKELRVLKEKGSIQKIGISLYDPKEIEMIWEDGIDLDIIQIPYNIFDRRFEKLMPEIVDRGTEIHTRSAFLQGLFFKNLNLLPAHFEKVEFKLNQLNAISSNHSLSMIDLSLGFCLKNRYISKVVIGVDSLSQLKSNLESALSNKILDFNWELLDGLSEEDIDIINPSKWKL